MIKYEGEYIKNMERVKLCKNCNQWKQTTSLTFLLPMMFDWIYKSIYDSDKVLMWVHQK